MGMRAWMGLFALMGGMCPMAAAGSDGVIEVSQACATGAGCAPGDTGGFPVRLGSGSYRLTSDLSFSESSSVGIEIVGVGVTLDFNGFKLSGDPGTGVIQTAISGTTLLTAVKNG